MSKSDDKLLKKIKNHVEMAESANEDNLQTFQDCQRFIYTKDGQFTNEEKKYYNNHSKPMLVANRQYVNHKRTVGAQRNLKRSVQIREIAGSPDADNQQQIAQKKIDLLQNIVESIAFHSNATRIYERGFSDSLFGFGGWITKPKFESDYGDGAFEQVLEQKAISPEDLYWDPDAKELAKDDGQFMGRKFTLTASELKNQYDFDPNDAKYRLMLIDDDKMNNWVSDYGKETERYKVCHHFYKKPYKRKIVELSNGFKKVVCDLDEAEDKLEELNTEAMIQAMQSGQPQPPPYQVTNERVARCTKIKEVIFCGKKILEKNDCLIDIFPISLVFSDSFRNDEGEFKTVPNSYFGQDLQKMNNIAISAIAECLTRYRTERIIGGKTNIPNDPDSEQIWSNISEYEGFVPWNSTSAFPVPHVMEGREIPQSLLATIGVVNQMLSDQIGRAPSSSMNPSNSSGASVDSIAREDNENENLSFDNLNCAIEYTARVILKFVPKIYDSYRQINVSTSNGNQGITINDPSKPETSIEDRSYEITVKTGPAFEMQKQQTAEALMSLVQANPQILTLTADLIAKNLDVNDAEKIAERLYFLLDPRVLKELDIELPQLPPHQQQPTPMEQAQIAIQQAELKLKQQELQSTQQVNQMKMEIESQKIQIQGIQAQMDFEIEQDKMKAGDRKAALAAKADAIKAHAEIIKSVEATHSNIQTEHIKARSAKETASAKANQGTSA